MKNILKKESRVKLDRLCIRFLMVHIRKFVESTLYGFVFTKLDKKTTLRLRGIIDRHLKELRKRKAFTNYTITLDPTESSIIITIDIHATPPMKNFSVICKSEHRECASAEDKKSS